MAAAKMKIESAAFVHEATIPARHTADGPDLSPALTWSEPPPGTGSLALICDDPDAPGGTWVHWVLFNMAPGTRSLPEGVAKKEQGPAGSLQGINDFGKVGYGGPSPPRGPAHRYYFKLYALDTPLALKAGATKADVEKAMRGHILGEATLMGRYGRG